MSLNRPGRDTPVSSIEEVFVEAAAQGDFGILNLELVYSVNGGPESDVKPEASFVNDLGADSLDTVELVMALEEEFGVEIPDEDAEKIATVANAIDYIKAKAK